MRRVVTSQPPALLDLAVSLALEAGALLLDHRDRVLDVDTKSSTTDPVSEADRASERLITSGIRSARPDDGILGEEDAANREGGSGLRWVIDPLDGTVNFLFGIPFWCVSICCEDDEGARIGVVHDPHRDETFTAVRGDGAQLNGRTLELNRSAGLDRAMIATGFSYGPRIRVEQARWLTDLIGRARDVRRFGAAALDLSWTAAGRVDGFYELGLERWDRAAGELIVREAGGRTSHVDVEVLGQETVCVVAGAEALHAELVDWVRDVAAAGGTPG
jgi:myo-inositol-1(or 4)-monophosphatase